jgi:hypothetical protein
VFVSWLKWIKKSLLGSKSKQNKINCAFSVMYKDRLFIKYNTLLLVESELVLQKMGEEPLSLYRDAQKLTENI